MVADKLVTTPTEINSSFPKIYGKENVHLIPNRAIRIE
jgi:hypothetical protein